MCIAVPTLPIYLLAHRLPRASCSLPSYFPKPEAAIPPPHQLWELGGRQANRQGAKGVRQAEAGSRRSIEPMFFSCTSPRFSPFCTLCVSGGRGAVVVPHCGQQWGLCVCFVNLPSSPPPPSLGTHVFIFAGPVERTQVILMIEFLCITALSTSVKALHAQGISSSRHFFVKNEVHKRLDAQRQSCVSTSSISSSSQCPQPLMLHRRRALPARMHAVIHTSLIQLQLQ